MKVYNSKDISELVTRYYKGEKIPKIFFRNLPGFRNSKILFEYTVDEIKEISRCKKDIIYFAEKYCKILDPTTGNYSNIVLHDYQKDFLLSIESEKYNIVNTSRQVGITLIESIYLLHTFIFSTDRTILIIENKLDIAIEKLQKIKNMYELLPFFMKTGIISSNKRLFNGENLTRIKVSAATKQLAIGYTINDLYLGNLSHVRPSITEPMFKSIIPCMTAMKDSKIVITSTPNGFNYFYKLFQDAEANKNSFKPHRIYWWQVPGRDEAWKENEIKNLGSQEAFEQEYNLKFFNKK